MIEVREMTNQLEGSIRIAVIDDDASLRSAVSRLLRSHNYACKVYESAEAALADPDLAAMHCLVIDIQLSGMSGFALRDRLVGSGVRVPFLFITAHAETSSPEWMRAIAGNPCVIKPFDEAQLLEAIHHVLEKRVRLPSP